MADEPSTSTVRDDVIQERAEGNAADFLEHGPRLSINRSTWIVARGDGKVMAGGLGAFGRAGQDGGSGPGHDPVGRP